MTAIDREYLIGSPAPSTVLRRIGGSLCVSLVTSTLSLSVLGALTFTDVVPPWAANVLATIAGIGPSYALNRRWVWRRTTRSSIRREIGPYWTMCLLALVVSTVTVSVAAGWADGRDLGDTVRTVVVLGVNIATFGALWIFQFIVLDRFLFQDAKDRSGDRGTTTPMILGAMTAVGLASTLAVTPFVSEAAPRNPDVSCAYTITSAWPDGAIGDLAIANDTDRTLTTWTVEIDQGSSEVRLWNADELMREREQITARDLGWNGTVSAGETVHVAGGTVTGSGLGVGDEFGCSVVTPSPNPLDVTCSFTLTNAWRAGGYGDLTLTDSDDVDVTGWTVRLDSNRDTIWFPGAEVVSRDARHLTVINRSWNGTVDAMGSATPTMGLVSGTGFTTGQSIACSVVDVT